MQDLTLNLPRCVVCVFQAQSCCLINFRKERSRLPAKYSPAGPAACLRGDETEGRVTTTWSRNQWSFNFRQDAAWSPTDSLEAQVIVIKHREVHVTGPEKVESKLFFAWISEEGWNILFCIFHRDTYWVGLVNSCLLLFCIDFSWTSEEEQQKLNVFQKVHLVKWTEGTFRLAGEKKPRAVGSRISF